MAKLIKILSPDFVEVEGLILLPTELKHYRKNWKGSQDKSKFEAFQNHTHMIDLFKHDVALEAPNPAGNFWDSSHPDFQELCFVGKFMARMWFEKLKEQFPLYRFRVYYTEQDNPVVRFHRVRPGEPFWMDETQWPDDVASGRIIVYDTEKS